MANETSASTISLVGYLTEKGRDYLFGVNNNGTPKRIVDGVDLFKPEKFSLYDSDTNYKSTERIETGGAIAIAGTGGIKCIKTASNQVKTNILIFGEGNTPSISFEQPLYEVGEGEGINFSVGLSHYQFGFLDRSAIGSIDEVKTTLPPTDYEFDIPFPSDFIFKDSIKDIPISFSSTTDLSIIQGETKDVVLSLSDYVESLPGENQEVIIRILGNGPPLSLINIEDSLQTIIVPDTNVFNRIESFIFMDRESVITDRKVNVFITLSPNLQPFIDQVGISFTRSRSAGEGQQPLYYDPSVVRDLMKNGEPVPLDIRDGDSIIDFKVLVFNIPDFSPGTTEYVDLTLADPGQHIILGEQITKRVNVTKADLPQFVEVCEDVQTEIVYPEGYDAFIGKWQCSTISDNVSVPGGTINGVGGVQFRDSDVTGEVTGTNPKITVTSCTFLPKYETTQVCTMVEVQN